MGQHQQEGKHRRSIRLQDYDYSRNGAYFITICTQNRECFFGDIVGEEMRLNDAGTMVESVWHGLPERFPGVSLDASIVMPNHTHGIILIDHPNVGANLVFPPHTAAQRRMPDSGRIQDSPLRPTGTLPGTVGRIIQAYKSLTTLEYTAGVKQRGWPSFPGRLWQRNYYEHIIRSEKDLDALREYILNNPLKWALDAENPLRTG